MRSKHQLEIENYGGVQKDHKKEKEGDEFFNQIIKGIFTNNKNSSLNNSKKEILIPEKNRNKQNIFNKDYNKKKIKNGANGINISKIKKSGKEDFGLKKYFFFITLLFFFSLIPLIFFFYVSAGTINVMKSLQNLDKNCNNINQNIEKLLVFQVEMVYNKFLSSEKFYENNELEFKEFFEYDIEDFKFFVEEIDSLGEEVLEFKRNINILENEATSKIGISGVFNKILHIENKRFELKNNYFFGKEKICQIMKIETADKIFDDYKFERVKEVEGKINKVADTFKDNINYFSNFSNVYDIDSECEISFGENFNKNLNFFESYVKSKIKIIAINLNNTEIAGQNIQSFYKNNTIFEDNFDFSIIIYPILELQTSILKIKNSEIHFLLKEINLLNSISLLIILLIIQIFLYKFVKTSLELNFSAHQHFLSLFDIEVIMKKKILKQYFDLYDKETAKQLFEITWYG